MFVNVDTINSQIGYAMGPVANATIVRTSHGDLVLSSPWHEQLKNLTWYL